MKPIGNPSVSGRRAMAVLVVALMLLVPALWTIWSLHESTVVTETLRSQSIVLTGLKSRLAQLESGPVSTGALADSASIYLPGETAAIAGAALQRLVANTIEAAGGRVVESESAAADPSVEDPGRVDLRVSFDTEIVGLQQILFELESGVPVLLLRALNVQSPGAIEVAGMESPPLRIEMQVGGYWESAQ